MNILSFLGIVGISVTTGVVSGTYLYLNANHWYPIFEYYYPWHNDYYPFFIWQSWIMSSVIVISLISLLLFLVGTKTNEGKFKRKLFTFSLVWGCFIGSGTYMFDVRHHVFDNIFWTLTVLVSLFIALCFVYLISRKDFAFIFPILDYEPEKEKGDEKITVQKVGFYLFQFVVSPVIVGLILGFFSLLITGQFNGAGGVTLIGALVTVASNSNSGQA